jgi:D-alanyl-D-alanine carboxypeptidase
VGLKTGSTSPAGKCLLAAYQVEGGYLIIGVFGCIESTSRFTAANTLFDCYLEQQATLLP